MDVPTAPVEFAERLDRVGGNEGMWYSILVLVFPAFCTQANLSSYMAGCTMKSILADGVDGDL